MTRVPFLYELTAATVLALLLAFGLRPALTGMTWSVWTLLVFVLASGITWLVFATSAAIRDVRAGGAR